MKQYRVNGLSFEEELRGENIPFKKRTIYIGLNGVLQDCNWNCKYCLEGSWKERKNNYDQIMNLNEQLSIVDEAAHLGIKGLLITGGEPLSPSRQHDTMEIVKRAHSKGVVPLIYTNGSYLDEFIAKELADNGSSVAFKIDSLIPEKYDEIAGKKGAYNSTIRAIENAKKTSIGEIIVENDSEILVRMLFTTVGNALNVDEYVSIARFATEHGARWMMETINHRGNAQKNSDLYLNLKKHNESMEYALLLNPEQKHSIDKQGYCRLFYMITINTSNGNFGICPQDYSYLGNIREMPLNNAFEKVLEKVNNPKIINSWNAGQCPIKTNNNYNRLMKL